MAFLLLLHPMNVVGAVVLTAPRETVLEIQTSTDSDCCGNEPQVQGTLDQQPSAPASQTQGAGQSKAASTAEAYQTYLKDDIVRRRQTDPGATIEVGRGGFLYVYVAIMAKKLKSSFLLAAEDSRTDQQVGSTPSSSGTTSLTQKGGVPTVLGFAVENGALTQSISGTTVTFRGTPMGIIKALEKKGYMQSFEEIQSQAFTRFFNNLSFSVSFDTSRGNNQPSAQGSSQPAANVFTGDKQQLSEFTIRYNLINHRDPRGKFYNKKWVEFFHDDLPTLSSTLTQLNNVFLLKDPPRFKNQALQNWFLSAHETIRRTGIDQVDQALQQEFATIPADKLTQEELTALQVFATSFENYVSVADDLVSEINKAAVITLQYTDTRNVNTPNLSNFMFIAEGGTPTLDATFNGSATTFDKLPMGVTNRVRDFQLSGEVDKSLNNVMGLSKVILFASARFQHFFVDLPNPAAMMAAGTTPMTTMTIPNTKGNMAVAQFGLKIPLKDTGFSIPISFSVANRTDLIKEKEVRGNIGFTFDFNTLFAKLKP
jgi:hypothetical protein